MGPPLMVLLLLPLVECYPRRVPLSACSSMMPSHSGARAQTSAPPYKILIGKHPDSIADVAGVFKGFYIQARDESNNTVGMFHDERQLHAMTQTCMEKFQSAAHHTSKDKKKYIQLRWTPPGIANGNVHFKATILRSYNTFWTNVMSEDITAASISQPLPDLYGVEPVDTIGKVDSRESSEEITDRRYYRGHDSSEEDSSEEDSSEEDSSEEHN